MSNDFNKVIITGRLTNNPVKTSIPTQKGDISLLKFSIANQIYKSDKPNYFDCEYWGKGAEFFADRLVKGSLVLIEGELKQSKWVDKNTNENRYKIVINVRNINLLSFDKNLQAKNQKNDVNVSTTLNVDNGITVKPVDDIEAPPLVDGEDPFSPSEFGPDDYGFDENASDFENDDNIFYK